MKSTLCCVLYILCFLTTYSQGISSEFKHNWIAIIHNPDDKAGFDTLLLYPDNDKIDTSSLFYCYWVYQNHNKFFWGYFDKRNPGNELVNVCYQKWNIRKENILSIKNCKTRKRTYYKIFASKETSDNKLSLMLTRIPYARRDTNNNLH